MVPSGFLQKNSFRRCCILCLMTISLCVETLLSQTDSLDTNAISRYSSPIVRYGVYPAMEIGFGTIGAGLGGLVGVLAGGIVGSPSDGEFGALGFAIIGGSIGIVAGSTIVVHQVCLKTGLNSSGERTFLGSALGFGTAMAYYHNSGQEIDLVFFLLPAAGATFFAHLGGYKQTGQQAFVSPLIRVDTEKDCLDRTYSCVKVQLVAVTF
jgi:hypothetical protein